MIYGIKGFSDVNRGCQKQDYKKMRSSQINGTRRLHACMWGCLERVVRWVVRWATGCLYRYNVGVPVRMLKDGLICAQLEICYALGC